MSGLHNGHSTTRHEALVESFITTGAGGSLVFQSLVPFRDGRFFIAAGGQP